MTNKKVEIGGRVEMSISRLERIAEFYEFPMAVFFGGEFKTRTISETLRKKAKLFDEIWDITERGVE